MIEYNFETTICDSYGKDKYGMSEQNHAGTSQHIRHDKYMLLNQIRLREFAIIAALITLVGCQQQAGQKLLGEWIGRPDTSETRTKREIEKYGDTSSYKESDSEQGDKKTDWEDFDVTLLWDFKNRYDLEITLKDSGDKVSGNWKIIGTSPTGCTIEVMTENKDLAEADSSNAIRRRFEIEFDEREGEVVGFLLHESGADRQLGILYFQRPI